jgi:hypothetical protein
MDASGEVYRNEENGLHMEVTKSTESGGLETFEFAAGDPRKGEKNSYAIGKGEIRGGTFVMGEFRIGEKYESLRGEILQNFANDIGMNIDFEGQAYAPAGEGRSLRFGWEPQKAAPARFDFSRKYYGEPDTKADIAAKQEFARSLLSLDTRLGGEKAANTVVDFYDTVGRKWFGMGFDAFTKRLTGNNVEGLLTQELNDEQVARWVAKNEGKAADAGAVARIRENLTDAQREEARRNIRGFAVPGADGATKAIYAAKDADVSTFVHEGVHAFTQLAKAADTELYRRMMDAAGFDQKAYNAADVAGKERIMREAMETLAYGAEAYLKNGPKSVSNSALRDLYERLKEFLKDLADAARKAEYLTPEVQALFDGLFGDNNGQAQEVAGSMAKGEAALEGAGARPEAKPAEEGLEIYSDNFDRDIKDKSLSVEKRSEAAVRKAGRDYGDALLDKRDRSHLPTAELIKRAMRIEDTAERQRAIAGIRELRKAYAGTAAEFKAPNGKESLLLSSLGEEKGKEAWYAVRTQNFKEWFGEWERAARIAGIESIPAKEYAPKNTTKKEAEQAFKDFEPVEKSFITDFIESNDVHKKPRTVSKYGNNVRKTALNVSFPKGTVGKLRGFFAADKANILSDARTIFENSQYGYSTNYEITESKADGSKHKTKDNIEAYHHFINKVNVGGTPYYVRFTVEELTNKGQLHSAQISEVEIIKEISREDSRSLPELNPGGTAQPAYDSSLVEFFNSVKGNVSKIVDKNGEPLAVFHGTNADFEVFDKRKIGSNTGRLDLGQGFYFSSKESGSLDGAANWYGEKLGSYYLSMEKPFIVPEDDGELGRMLLELDNDITTKQGEKISDRVAQNMQILLRDIHYSTLTNLLKNNGFDGVISGHEYVTFDPTQIKSATDNAGTFDPNNSSILFQRAYHGSPYSFDRFDNSHMGTGEGTQAYGYGMYFASKKEIAEYYRDLRDWKGKVKNNIYNGLTPREWYRHWNEKLYGMDLGKTVPVYHRIAMIQHFINGNNYDAALAIAKENKYSQEAISWFKETFKPYPLGTGNTNALSTL